MKMHKFSLLALFVCLPFFVLSQKIKRHEIAIGYSAGYYFDEYNMQIASDSDFNKRERSILPTFDYVFNLKKRFALGVHHARIWQYYNGPPDVYASDLLDMALLMRRTAKTGIYARYAIVNRLISLRIKTGFLYCVNGKRYHSHYVVHQFWHEFHTTALGFSSTGLTTAINISHPIYWRFYGEIDCEYNRFNEDFDNQQLFLSYRIGFRF